MYSADEFRFQNLRLRRTVQIPFALHPYKLISEAQGASVPFIWSEAVATQVWRAGGIATMMQRSQDF